MTGIDIEARLDNSLMVFILLESQRQRRTFLAGDGSRAPETGIEMIFTKKECEHCFPKSNINSDVCHYIFPVRKALYGKRYGLPRRSFRTHWCRSVAVAKIN